MRTNKNTVSDLIQNSFWSIRRSITNRPQTAPALSHVMTNGKKSNDNTLVSYMKKLHGNRPRSAIDHSSRTTTIKMPTSHVIFPKNYYQMLGVKQNASTHDVKKAYYQLAKFYHPDVSETNPEKSTKFKDISEAYSILVDESKRYEYDKFGSAKSKQSISHTTNWQMNISNACDACSMVASNDSGETTLDEITIPISFVQAALGTKRDITISSAIDCKNCKQNNRSHQSQVKLCNYCNGTGAILDKSSQDIKCKLCKGARYQFKSICTECTGRGTTLKKHRCSVIVPVGAVNDQLIKVLHPSENKHIFMRLKVEHSKLFTRKDFDVYSSVVIPFTTAILGGELQVKTVHGDTLIKVVAGTECHSTIRIPAAGIRKPTIGSGDHIVSIVVKMPKNLTSRQKLLLESFDNNETGDYNDRHEHQGKGTETLTQVAAANRIHMKHFQKRAKQM